MPNRIANGVLVASLLLGGGSYSAYAQQNSGATQVASTCKGVVLDELGEPVLGATVTVVGTSIAAATNLDGEFTLANVKKGATIRVTYIGYDPMEVIFQGDPLTISLNQNATQLDEVVVMGYGVEQKRAKVTNSIAKVGEKTLTIGANANPAQALAGAVSGVKVNITSGDPSATPSIVVRGGTNWSGKSEPLVVVDGQIRSGLNDINPNDIASMEILKDAGATALYGARAANGVIIISTKQGQAGKSSVTFSGKYGFNWYGTGYDMVGARDYIYYIRQGINNTEWAHTRNGTAGLSANNQPHGVGRTEITDDMMWNIMTMTDQNKYLLEQGWESMQDPIDPNRTILFRDSKMTDVNMQSPAYTQDYNLSFTGGNDRGKYYASLGYYDADGAFKTTFYKRYNFAFTGGYKINDWLESNSMFNFIRSNWNNSPLGTTATDAGYIFGRMMSLPPTLRLTKEDGSPALGQNAENTNFSYQPDKFHRDRESNKFQLTQSLTAQLIPGLKLKGTMSWYYNYEHQFNYNQEYQTSPAAQPGGTNGWNKNYDQSASYLRYFDQTYNLVANFNRTFAEKHTVNAMLGWEFYHRSYKAFSGSGNKLPSGDWFNLSATFAGTQNPYQPSSRVLSSNISEEKILSWFGRVEYDYMDKYLIAATFRRDGYSRLINNRWGFFPGVSAGWVFSQEDFWGSTGLSDIINYGKLRGSYGLNGIVNGNTIGYYTLQGTYGASNYNGNYGYRITGLPNPNLKWERTRTGEVGLDLGFLQNRFNLGLTYYNRLTMDKYANYALPPTTGFSSVVNNNGKFRNQGIEIDINGTLLRGKDYTWTAGLNLTYNKNTVVELPDNEFPRNGQSMTLVYDGNKKDADGNYVKKYIGGLQEGQEPGHVIGYRKSYIVRSESEMPKGYIDISGGYCSVYADDEGYQRLVEMGRQNGAVKLQPGDLVFMDRNGDNMIDQYDQYDLGCLTPHWTGGFNTTFTWKGLSLYARFDMGFDYKTYDNNLAWWLGCGQGTYSFPEQIKDTWTTDNPNAKYPRYVWASIFGTDAWIRTSDLLCQNANYLAVREVSLSYQLPQSICNKFRAQGLTISVTGQNLGYLKSCTNPLPDNVVYSSGNTAGWGGTYNLPRQLILGLNLTF